MPDSVYRARGFKSAKAYVKTRVMPVVGAQIIGTRPMLWSSVCKCRNPNALRPETRARALELLAGGQLLHAIGRLNGSGVREMLSELLEDLSALLQADKVSPAKGRRSHWAPLTKSQMYLSPHPRGRSVLACQCHEYA